MDESRRLNPFPAIRSISINVGSTIKIVDDSGVRLHCNASCYTKWVRVFIAHVAVGSSIDFFPTISRSFLITCSIYFKAKLLLCSHNVLISHRP